jgi:hypothetical protein
MAIFTKAIIGSAVAGTIALGAMVTYDGGSTIDLAKTKITEAGQNIGVFKSNETKLIGKVTSLKNEKATLTAQVADLEVQLATEKAKNVTDNERINQLEAQIATKTAEIAELTAEIATLTADLENAVGNAAETVERINALEAELNAANEQAEELQYTLDETVLAEPDQVAVDAALADTGGEVVVPDPIEPDPVDPVDPEPTPEYPEINMVIGTPMFLSTDEKLVLVKTPIADKYELVINNTSGSDSYTITLDGVDTVVGANGTMNLGKNDELDGKTLTVKGWNGTKTYTLVNK